MPVFWTLFLKYVLENRGERSAAGLGVAVLLVMGGADLLPVDVEPGHQKESTLCFKTKNASSLLGTRVKKTTMRTG